MDNFTVALAAACGSYRPENPQPARFRGLRAKPPKFLADWQTSLADWFNYQNILNVYKDVLVYYLQLPWGPMAVGAYLLMFDINYI